ncbi:PREDICTED: protein FAM166A [Eurypyga helias]|uniref:protein FAM166A n=1 Tax=Eurypyga helias TaxID=54383 RepID=UPI0005291641|nr:PREDICTED: protein FAM166A [Eurypyga helias]
MAAREENSLFPPNPYHIPGYGGFIPQYNYRFGETFGKTTNRLLTDPGVAKSTRPLLAPLHKQNFTEDLGGTERGVQGFLPGHPGYSPYEKPGAVTSFAEPDLGTKPPQPGPEEEEPMTTHVDPVSQHHPGGYVPRIQLPPGYPQEISCHPASEGQEWRLPKLSPAFGEEERYGPGQLGSALAGSKLPVKIEGVAETAGMEQDNWLPKLDVPNAIQQKVIPGYTGFIPCLTLISGVNYTQAVMEAMTEFNRHQFFQRNPAYSFGKRFPQTYWPNKRIYTSAGQIPFYKGFIPELQQTCALTFGNSTRQAYRKEQKRRGCAL